MNTKTTLILALLAVAVAAYLFFVEKPWQEAPVAETPATSEKPVFEANWEDIDRIEMTLRGDRAVFARQNGLWMMLEPIETSAATGHLESLLRSVLNVQYVKVHEPGDESYPSESVTRLDEPRAEFRLFKGDDQLADLKVGAALPTGSGEYIQRGDSKNVLETAQATSKQLLSRKITEYRNKRIFPVDFGTPQRITVEGMNNYTLVKNGLQWRVESSPSGPANIQQVRLLYQAALNMVTDEFKDEDPASFQPFGLSPPRLKVTVEAEKTVQPKPEPGSTQPAATQPTQEVKTYTLLVGAPTDTDAMHYFAKTASSPVVFTLSKSTFEQLTKPVDNVREKKIVDIDAGKVNRVEAARPQGQMTLTQNEQQWMYGDGTKADRLAVTELLQAAASLQATDFVDPEKTLIPIDWDQPRGRLVLYEEGKPGPTTLLIGPTDPSGKMAMVRSAEVEVVAVVREEEVKPFLAPPISYRDRQVMSLLKPQVTALTLETAANGTVTLDKINNNWQMTAPIDGEANTEAVGNLLTDLSSLRAADLVATADRKADFGLDQPTATVLATTEVRRIKPAPTTTQATDTQAADTQPAEETVTETHKLLLSQKDGQVYAMTDGGQMIFRLEDKVYADATAEMLDPQILNLTADEVTEITFGTGEEKLTLRRKDQEFECLSYPLVPIDKSKVTEAISAVVDLSTDRFVSYQTDDLAQFGLDQPAARVHLMCQDGTSQTVLLSASGPENTDGARYATLAHTGRVFLVDGEKADAFSKRLEDFEKE